jgi:hypothetical protein
VRFDEFDELIVRHWRTPARRFFISADNGLGWLGHSVPAIDARDKDQILPVIWTYAFVRLALFAVVAQACRHFGLSRKSFYKWKGPIRSSWRCWPARSGAGRIADYLQRFHQLKVARSSVHRILLRHGLNLLPANHKRKLAGRAWKRYEKPQPGHRLQLDVKFLERIAGTRKRLYQFTAIDDCTRIRVLNGASSDF